MKKSFKIMLNLCLLATITFISCKDSKPIVDKDAHTALFNKDGTTVKFTGIITEVKNDCWSDGICSIEVNNEWWIAIVYGKRDPARIPKERGTATGIKFTENDESIGKKVNVYAAIKEKNRLTLEGDTAYYVEVIKN